jgi:hypothetical protein
MKKFQCLIIIMCVCHTYLFFLPQVFAKKLTSEARSVIQHIQKKGNALSGTLTEFHQEFSASAGKMVKLEFLVNELKKKNYLGQKYEETPEKYERVYAEYAHYISEIKDVFIKNFPKIQQALADFNRSVYHGKDRIAELKSDDLAIVETELGRSKQILGKLQAKRSELEADCPYNRNSHKMTRNCQNQWRDYKRQLRNLKRSVARLKYMKKISNLKDSISQKLTEIMERYVYKESETVDMLMNYAMSFEQYASFIGSTELGGMLSTFKELAKLETKLQHFEQFQVGLDSHVADMGRIVDDRVDNFMEKSGMGDVKVESRGDILRSFEDEEQMLAETILDLEKDLK